MTSNMSNNNIIFVDDDSSERKGCGDVLTEIFNGTGLSVTPLEPLAELPSYAELAARESTAAFILDQRLGTSGKASYTGIELAQFLRSVSPKIPIVILTNFSSDDFGAGTCSVECVVQKARVLQNPTSPEAVEFRERLLRHINVFTDIAGERAKRYHELLVRSLREKLTAEEEKELGLLETERLLPQQAEEIGDVQALEKAVAELKQRLQEDEPSLY